MKELRQFNKKLGPKQFFQADLILKHSDEDFKEKLEKCFHLRIDKLQKQQSKESKTWS